MSPAGTPREVRASTEGHVVSVQQMASAILGGTELIPRFKALLAIARLFDRVQGTFGKAGPTPHGGEWTCESRIHPVEC